MTMLSLQCFMILISVLVHEVFGDDCYVDNKLLSVPSDHVYWMLKEPLVIGYKGNMMEYQENTLEGIQSLIDIKADGVHMQVQLTKDDQLIVFGEDNLYRMTGEDYDVSKLPYSEIIKMNLKEKIYYLTPGSQRVWKSYRSTLKIPLLSSVLNILSNTKMLIYLEILPDHVPPRGPFDREMADRTSNFTADIIRKYKLEQNVFVVSKDAFTLKSLNYYAPDIVSGWWIDTAIFDPSTAEGIRVNYNDLLDRPTCFEGHSNETKFAKYLLKSGIIHKSVNASIVDVSLPIINNTQHYIDNNIELKDIVSNNYGPITMGTFEVFPWSLKSSSKKDDVVLITAAYQKGIKRFVTNDVNRVKEALHEVITVYNTANTLPNYLSLLLLTLLLGKALVSVMFL